VSAWGGPSGPPLFVRLAIQLRSAPLSVIACDSMYPQLGQGADVGRRLARLYGFAFGLIVLSVAVSSSAAAAHAQPLTCALSGTAVDAETGAPAVGIDVAAYCWNPATRDWGEMQEGVVEPDGTFVLQVEHSAGDRVVVLFRGRHRYFSQAYSGVAFTWDEWWPSWPSPMPDADFMQQADKVALVDGPVSIGTIRMRPKPTPFGAISGRVTEQFGHPRAWQPLRVWHEDPETGVWTAPYWTQANSAGVYAVMGTAERPLVGRIKVEFGFHPDYIDGYFGGSTLETARVVTVKSGQTVYGINQVIPVTGLITGRVMHTATKLPVNHAELSVIRYPVDSGIEDAVGGDRTGSDGLYASGPPENTPAGDFILSVRTPANYPNQVLPYFYGQTRVLSKARPVTLEDGGTVPDRDIWFSTTSAVAGKVNNMFGRALSDVLVQVYRVSAGGSLTMVGSDYTDAIGMFRVMCPGAGNYTVRYLDQAGTSAIADDSEVWLGGAASGATATVLAVPKNDVAVAEPLAMQPADDARASRVYGLNGYETAIAASQASFAAGETTAVVLVSGVAFADALSGTNISGAAQAPVLLTYTDAVYPGLLDEFARLGTKTIYLIGGTAVLSARQEETLKALGYEVIRIGGSDRYVVNANSLTVADQLTGIDAEVPVFVTSGASFTDALAIAPAVYASGGAVALVSPDAAPKSVAQTLKRLGIKRAYGVGGAGSLTPKAVAGLGVAGTKVTRIASGADRYHTAALFAASARSRGWLSGEQIGIATGTSFADALVAGSGLGRQRGVLLLAKVGSLPTPTANALRSMHATSKNVTVYGAPASISSKVLVQSGSR